MAKCSPAPGPGHVIPSAITPAHDRRERFAADYETWSAHMTADVAFYVGLARRADGQLVELAVGNGRVAIPVARATGRRVIGIDTSSTMLEQARTGAARPASISTCASAICATSS